LCYNTDDQRVVEQVQALEAVFGKGAYHPALVRSVGERIDHF